MAQAERNFLRFLIEASPQQTKSVLKHITPKQLTALSETCYNITHSEVDPDIIANLKPYRTLIRELGDKSISAKRRAAIAARHYKKLGRILQTAQPILP